MRSDLLPTTRSLPFVLLALLMLAGCAPQLADRGDDDATPDDDATTDDDDATADDDDTTVDPNREGAVVSIDVEGIDFGPVPVGDVAEGVLSIMSVGTDVLQLQDLVLSDTARFTMTNLDDLVPLLVPGESFELEIAFTPAEVGPVEERLVVATNDIEVPESVVLLTGVGQ